jgi:hypothetical protein
LPAAVEEEPVITFRDRTALRSGIVCALLCLVLTFVLGAILPGPLKQMSMFLSAPACGWLSVWFYRRWSGLTLSLEEGARMGWLTGVFIGLLLLIVTILFLLLLPTMVQSPELMKDPAFQTEEMKQGIALLTNPKSDPWSFAGAVLLASGLSFLLGMVSGSLGGLLGARWLRR